MTRAALLLVLACTGCSSARIAGGEAVVPGAEPAGVTVARFHVGRCEDANGQRMPEAESRIAVVRRADGKLVLVERRPGYDSLVVDNGWDEPGAHVFQLAFKRSSRRPQVREYRMPLDGNTFGRLALVKQVRTWGDSAHGFHARYAKAAIVCDLPPEG